MVRKVAILLALAVASTAVVLAAGSPSGQRPAQRMSGKLSPAESKFIMQAYQGGQAEVRLGHLAAERGASDAVKQFGQRMEQDHSSANRSLGELASRKGVHVSDRLSSTDQALVSRLSRMKGTEFDRQYMTAMVRDHQKDVAEFQRESRMAHDPDLKNWITSTLPTLQEHLRMATADSRQVNGRR